MTDLYRSWLFIYYDEGVVCSVYEDLVVDDDGNIVSTLRSYRYTGWRHG